MEDILKTQEFFRPHQVQSLLETNPTLITNLMGHYLTDTKTSLCKSAHQDDIGWKCGTSVNKIPNNPTDCRGLIPCLPVYWQDFYGLYYYALSCLKTIPDDSQVISLGESPAKITYNMELFYNNPITKEILSDYEFYPKDIEFGYFPLSGLSSMGADYPASQFEYYRHHTFDSLYKQIEDWFLENDELIRDYYLPHFINYGIDPLSVINNSKKNLVILDRTESNRSILAFIYLYFKLLDMQDLNIQQKITFIKKFKLRGFDIDNRIYGSAPGDSKNPIQNVLIHEFSILCINKMITKSIHNLISSFSSPLRHTIESDKNWNNPLLFNSLNLYFIEDEYNVTYFGLEKDMSEKLKPLISDISKRTTSDGLSSLNIEDTIKTIIKHTNYPGEWKQQNHTQFIDGPIWGKKKHIRSIKNVSDDLYKNNLLINGIPFYTMNYLPEFISLDIEKYAPFLYNFYNIDGTPGDPISDLPNFTNRFMMNWLTVPEHLNNYSRCIQAVKKSNITELSTPNEASSYIDPTTRKAKIRLFNSRKDIAEGNQNCNIFNLISFLVFRRIVTNNPDSIRKLIFHVANNNISLIIKPIGQPEQRSIFFRDTDTLITEEDNYELPIKDEALEELRISQLPLQIQVSQEQLTEPSQNVSVDIDGRLSDLNELILKLQQNQRDPQARTPERRHPAQLRRARKARPVPVEKKTLFLDFDETLGSFHPYYSVIYRILKMNKIEQETIDTILKKILIYCLRPGISELLRFLNELKEKGLLTYIIILSSNSVNYDSVAGIQNVSALNYFRSVINYIEEIYNLKGLFYKIEIGVCPKILENHLPQDSNALTYIIDDKCKHIQPQESCISISPYFAYLSPELTRIIFEETSLSKDVVDKLQDYVISYHESIPELLSQYSQINRSKFVMKDNKIIINDDIEEIESIIQKLIGIYN